MTETRLKGSAGLRSDLNLPRRIRRAIWKANPSKPWSDFRVGPDISGPNNQSALSEAQGRARAIRNRPLADPLADRQDRSQSLLGRLRTTLSRVFSRGQRK